MNGEINRFQDAFSARKLTFVVPEGHESPRGQVDQIEMAFRQECEEQPDVVRLVAIYTQQGRLALDIFAHGSEALLHQNAKRWSTMMYPQRDDMPLGHQWSIDAPENIGRIVVE